MILYWWSWQLSTINIPSIVQYILFSLGIGACLYFHLLVQEPIWIVLLYCICTALLLGVIHAFLSPLLHWLLNLKGKSLKKTPHQHILSVFKDILELKVSGESFCLVNISLNKPSHGVKNICAIYNSFCKFLITDIRALPIF